MSQENKMMLTVNRVMATGEPAPPPPPPEPTQEEGGSQP